MNEPKSEEVELGYEEVGPSYQIPVGTHLENGWVVIEHVARTAVSTGGNFSVPYVVERKGNKAFLKAADIESAMGKKDIIASLKKLSTEFDFEKSILESCRAGGMNRVIRILDDGVFRPGKVATPIPYLVFELASQDLRNRRSNVNEFKFSWGVRCLHNVCVGLNQLHQKGIVHQDIKPSNVLVFSSNLQKIGDLGRASVKGRTGPFDALSYAGPAMYAPPELLYRVPELTWEERRLGCDVYLLGSLLYYVATSSILTLEIINKLRALDTSLDFRSYSGGYEEILPVIRSLFDGIVVEFEDSLPVYLDVKTARELTLILRELCDPDPAKRGHSGPAHLHASTPLYLYISRLDRLARSSASHEKKKEPR